jgi:hypothetical protein
MRLLIDLTQGGEQVVEPRPPGLPPSYHEPRFMVQCESRIHEHSRARKYEQSTFGGLNTGCFGNGYEKTEESLVIGNPTDTWSDFCFFPVLVRHGPTDANGSSNAVRKKIGRRSLAI